MSWIRNACLPAVVAGVGSAQAGKTLPALQVAKFDVSRRLHRPDNLERWVFVGAGLGMNYSGEAVSVEHPGSFQVVLMEASAYE